MMAGPRQARRRRASACGEPSPGGTERSPCRQALPPAGGQCKHSGAARLGLTRRPAPGSPGRLRCTGRSACHPAVAGFGLGVPGARAGRRVGGTSGPGGLRCLHAPICQPPTRARRPAAHLLPGVDLDFVFGVEVRHDVIALQRGGRERGSMMMMGGLPLRRSRQSSAWAGAAPRRAASALRLAALAPAAARACRPARAACPPGCSTQSGPRPPPWRRPPG